MKIGTIQVLACVGVGAVLGFIAATRDSGPASRAHGATPASRQESAETGETGRGADKAPYCADGAARNVLLARAEPGAARAGASSTAPARSRTSSSSSATTSAPGTSAPTRTA
jgi:hypothetical protein